MPSKNLILVSIGVMGLLIGLGASTTMQEQKSSSCSSIQEQVKQNQSFSGSVACYPPGHLDVDISDRIAERAELDCVCRIIDESGASLYPVAFSK